eukprot:CAMPEP_0115846036 /NCGR_PEP_ID=MMETSP0287-20121206/9658_1 /TAXON_ID=412157 /ORGANISM="Chrysochromulina rotalis, Strain UIO044" /LENGTH=253 /DNA_ID=CAMNT_0003299823 /DNA_START=27 /DNA_END=790 /DNA_ORIENTATION=-
MASVKLTVGLEMLAEVRQGEVAASATRAHDHDDLVVCFPSQLTSCDLLLTCPQFDAAYGILGKVLSNIVASPDEAKFRKLRSSNAKIAAMLATKGVRAILIGVGFVEEGEFLTLPTDAPTPPVQEAIDRLIAQAEARTGAESAAKLQEMERRKESAEKENEERKRMKMQISDDAAARKEPGWTAKAAGVKGGRSIVTAQTSARLATAVADAKAAGVHAPPATPQVAHTPRPPTQDFMSHSHGLRLSAHVHLQG